MTPQENLYRLVDAVRRLNEKFESNDEEISFIEKIDEIHLANTSLIDRMDKIENQLSLIIKLLIK